MRRNPIARTALLCALCLAIAAGLTAASSKPILKLRAFAGRLGGARPTLISIDIYRWWTDQEREALPPPLKKFGQNKLLDTLQKVRPPVGRISVPGRLGWDLYYARDTANPDGSR